MMRPGSRSTSNATRSASPAWERVHRIPRMTHQIRRLFKGLHQNSTRIGHLHSVRLTPCAINDAEPKPSQPLTSESQQQADSADESDSQQLQWSNDAKALARRVSDTLATSGKDGPSNRELLQLLQQQSQLISKYQTRLDHTNATLLQYQKMLQRISTKLEVPSPSASDGYTNIALPETLSDKSIRDRSSADSSTSENEWRAEGSSDLLQGQRDAPASNNILYTPPDPRVIKYLPHRGTRQAPGGPAWSAGDRRALGGFDARFHSTSAGATPRDHRVLPQRIILVRHAQSEGNVNNIAYTSKPDPQIPLTEHGYEQAVAAGNKLLDICAPSGDDHKFFFYTSPYCRSVQTYKAIETVIPEHRHAGVQEEVQLREQDFGNFQDAALKAAEKSERLKYGRFFYRFPNGESGADVYDRITIFEDHMVRDINAGRFSSDVSLVLLTHGLALRIFLMRWFRWTVDEFLDVFNPPNAVPLVLERICAEDMAQGNLSWIHTKCLYRLSDESQKILKGASKEMCRMTESARLSTYPRSTPVKPPSDE